MILLIQMKKLHSFLSEPKLKVSNICSMSPIFEWGQMKRKIFIFLKLFVLPGISISIYVISFTFIPTVTSILSELKRLFR